jgi:hypothetical protein
VWGRQHRAVTPQSARRRIGGSERALNARAVPRCASRGPGVGKGELRHPGPPCVKRARPCVLICGRVRTQNRTLREIATRSLGGQHLLVGAVIQGRLRKGGDAQGRAALTSLPLGTFRSGAF